MTPGTGQQEYACGPTADLPETAGRRFRRPSYAPAEEQQRHRHHGKTSRQSLHTVRGSQTSGHSAHQTRFGRNQPNLPHRRPAPRGREGATPSHREPRLQRPGDAARARMQEYPEVGGYQHDNQLQRPAQAGRQRQQEDWRGEYRHGYY